MSMKRVILVTVALLKYCQQTRRFVYTHNIVGIRSLVTNIFVLITLSKTIYASPKAFAKIFYGWLQIVL